MDREDRVKEIIFELMKEEMGDDMPDPDHCPLQFQYKAKMIQYYRTEKINEILSTSGY